MENNSQIVIVIIVLALMPLSILYVRRKVIDYIYEKYGDVSDLSVRWTLFGPFAPGSNNMKFRVRFKDSSGESKEVYAVSSVWGSVYIRE